MCACVGAAQAGGSLRKAMKQGTFLPARRPGTVIVSLARPFRPKCSTTATSPMTFGGSDGQRNANIYSFSSLDLLHINPSCRQDMPVLVPLLTSVPVACSRSSQSLAVADLAQHTKNRQKRQSDNSFLFWNTEDSEITRPKARGLPCLSPR